ncbi:unnamed protein product [Acanthoscelides obtectus]|uniref:PBZ-type domain-containing protein n=2 Tax=Acanthoscelides obtectus TaxID=200917 RepID=A0A9P0PWY7_ACAOB|nr:unnamed protein product [Acanthoscelides obtectus]CAK1642370.1 Histone PARylation factor 1 [Acanthoscelides obtectus]
MSAQLLCVDSFLLLSNHTSSQCKSSLRYKMEYEKYVNDSRIPCKYGSKCYQKNPLHHEKYKHPPQKANPRKDRQHTQPRKKRKVEETNTKEQSNKKDLPVEDDADTSTETVDNCISGSESSESNEDTVCSDQMSDATSTESISDNNTESKDTRVSPHEKPDLKWQGIKTNTDAKEDEQTGKYKKFIKEKFFIELPQDFYAFWEFCKKLNSKNPLDALNGIHLKLVGPFDALAGKFDNIKKSDDDYLIHWRYFRDPPEFLTILKGNDKTGHHMGYFRDSSDEVPVVLASNESEKDGVFTIMGGNIFAAVRFYIENLKKIADPFMKMNIPKIEAQINKEAEKLSLDMSKKTKAIAARERKIVSRTMNKIGLVVPYDKKTQLGYRELAMNNKELKNVLDKLQDCLPEQREKYLSDLQPVLTYASIAADECDFGTGIELGWNLICHGIDSLNSTALQYLTSNYRLLNREAFAKIAEAHMKNRRKGCKLSVL